METQPELSSVTAEQPRYHRWLWLLVTLLVTLAAFVPHVNGDFLRNWDDGIFIVENKRMDFSAANVWRYASRRYRQLYTPLPMYSLMADKAFFGLKPWAFRLHNIVLHCIAAALLYLIFLRLKLPPLSGCLGTLLWAVHPQRNESVLWIVERKDVLCGVLVFGAFLAFLYALDSGKVLPGILCAVLTVLSMGCKPAAAPLCGVYVVYALMVRRWRWSLLIPVLAGCCAVIFVGVVTARGNPGGLQPDWLVPIHNLFWYPLTALLPLFNTSPIYPQVITFSAHLPLFLTGVLLITVLAIIVLRGRRIPLRFVIGAVLIVLGMLLPVLGLWQYTEFHYCDRYNYLVAPAVIAPLLLLLPRSRIVPAVLTVLAVLMLAATWHGGGMWKSDRALWRHCLKDSPVNPKAFQVASGDALMRSDADDLKYIASRLKEESAALALPGSKVENTADLLEAHAFILQEQYDRGIPILAQMIQREQRSGEELQFMRGDNYRYIFEEDAPLARFFLQRGKRNKKQ